MDVDCNGEFDLKLCSFGDKCQTGCPRQVVQQVKPKTIQWKVLDDEVEKQ